MISRAETTTCLQATCPRSSARSGLVRGLSFAGSYVHNNIPADGKPPMG